MAKANGVVAENTPDGSRTAALFAIDQEAHIKEVQVHFQCLGSNRTLRIAASRMKVGPEGFEPPAKGL